jgi:ferritin
MNEELEKIIDESIKLELNISNIYTIFGEVFPGDSAFWSDLALEEDHHASLIKDGQHTLSTEGEFPLDLLAPKVQMLEEVNGKLSALLEEYSKSIPSRETAFNVALNLEESAGEVHFQRAMEKPPTSTIMRMFQRLNKDDKNHADRIRTYMNEKGIEIDGDFII